MANQNEWNVMLQKTYEKNSKTKKDFYNIETLFLDFKEQKKLEF